MHKWFLDLLTPTPTRAATSAVHVVELAPLRVSSAVRTKSKQNNHRGRGFIHGESDAPYTWSRPAKHETLLPPAPHHYTVESRRTLTVATAFLLETIIPPEKVLTLSREGEDRPNADSPILPLPEKDELWRRDATKGGMT